VPRVLGMPPARSRGKRGSGGDQPRDANTGAREGREAPGSDARPLERQDGAQRKRSWTLRLQRRRAPTGVRSAWGEGVVGVPWTGGTAQLKAATREGEGAPTGRNTGGTVAGTDRGDGKLIGEGGREQRRPREMHGWPSCSGRRERGKQRGGNFAMTGDGRRNP